MLNKIAFCPVCGFDLGFPAWKGNSASDEICPSCGIHFGYDDVKEASGEEGTKEEIYKRWRKKWIKEGMKWWSIGHEKPNKWNPVEQLKNIGIEVCKPAKQPPSIWNSFTPLL